MHISSPANHPNLASVDFGHGAVEYYRATPGGGYVYLETIGGLRQICTGLREMGAALRWSGKAPLAALIRRELRA